MHLFSGVAFCFAPVLFMNYVYHAYRFYYLKLNAYIYSISISILAIVPKLKAILYCFVFFKLVVAQLCHQTLWNWNNMVELFAFFSTEFGGIIEQELI